jgi:membrane protein required for beta-lactamase induction
VTETHIKDHVAAKHIKDHVAAKHIKDHVAEKNFSEMQSFSFLNCLKFLYLVTVSRKLFISKINELYFNSFALFICIIVMGV